MERALRQPFALGVFKHPCASNSAALPILGVCADLGVGADKTTWRKRFDALTAPPQCRRGRSRSCKLEGGLLTAHLLFVLSHAKTCELRELEICTSYPGVYPGSYALNSHISRAISRFTLLTALNFSSLVVEAGTLQVSA